MRAALISCFGYYDQRIKFVEKLLKEDGYVTDIYFSDFDHINKQTVAKKIAGVTYIPTMPYDKNLSLSRIRSHQKFSHAVLKCIEQGDYDFIYAIIPPNTLCTLLSNYKKQHTVKLVYDIYDLWPESFVNKKIERLAYPFFAYWRNLRNKAVNDADRVITECNLYQDVLAGVVDKERMKTIYLSKDIEQLKAIPKKELLDELHICYLGSINNIIDTNMIATFLAEVSTYRSVVVELIGKGETKDEFIAAMKQKGIAICDHGAQYGQDKTNIINRCHFGINMMVDAVKVGLTMKSIDYFENCLPLINNIKVDTWDLVEQNQIGFNINKDNYQAMAKALAQVDNETYQQMMHNSLKVFNEHFSSVSFYKDLRAVLDACYK